MQKARDNIHQRNHLRLWLSPMRYHGKQVWVGQISRDIGSRLTIHSPTLTTHKIDPDVDEARSALAQDMAYSQNLAKIGYVKGVGAAPKSAPRGNLTTDPYYTDGLRVVLVFDRQPTSLAAVEFFPWEVSAHGRQAVKATGRRSMSAVSLIAKGEPPGSALAAASARKRAVCGEPLAWCRRLCDLAGSRHFQRRRVARTRRDCLQPRRECDGGGAQRRGQPAHVRRRRQQDRRAVGMDRTPEPDTRALVAAETRIGPRLLLAARSRVVRAHAAHAREANARIDDVFDKLAFKSPILPGETHAGVLFINPERRTRLLNIDLLQSKGLIPFSLFLPVPDDAADPHSGTISFSYPDAGITDYKDLAALRAALERLPCCASDASGTARGDPLNAIFVGELPDIAAALVRRSYRRDAQAVDAPQHVFGRGPDVVLRKQAQAGAPSTWIRLWLAPIRFEGRPVFLVQVGRPVGGRFVPRGAKDIVLQEDVDEARNLLVQDMMYSGGLEQARIRHRCRRGIPDTASNNSRWRSILHRWPARDPVLCHPTAQPVGRGVSRLGAVSRSARPRRTQREPPMNRLRTLLVVIAGGLCTGGMRDEAAGSLFGSTRRRLLSFQHPRRVCRTSGGAFARSTALCWRRANATFPTTGPARTR